MKREEILLAFRNAGYTYNAETGELFNGKGKIVKTKNKKGYIYLNLTIDGKRTHASGHVLCWFLHYNEVVPLDLQIDHKNRIKDDNRINNLRILTNQQNSFNTSSKGYSWNKQAGKYKSRIKKDGKLIFLGLFDTEQEARFAYLEAKKILHRI